MILPYGANLGRMEFSERTGWALLPGLDRQHRRERAESFANQHSTSFATKDRLERGSDAQGKRFGSLDSAKCGSHPSLGRAFWCGDVQAGFRANAPFVLAHPECA